MKKTKQPIIKKLEHLLHLDIGYFTKNSVFAVVQQIIGVICGLTLSYMFGHFLTKSVFGEYNLALSIISMYIFLSIPGIDTALTRSVGLGFEKSLIDGTKFKFISSLLGLPLLAITAFIYYIKGFNNIALIIFISAFFFPFLNSFTSYPSFLTGKKMFGLHTILASMSSIFFLISLTLAIIIAPTALGVTIGYLIGIIIPALISYIVSKKYVSKTSSTDPKLKRYGIFLTAITILPWISGNLSSIILGSFLGIEQLAIYTVANKFRVTVQKSFQVFYNSSMAKLANQSPKEHLETIQKHWFKLILFGFIIFILAWISAPFLINFFFTNSYSDSIKYCRLLAIILILLPISWILNDIVVYQKRKKTQIFSSIVFPIIKIILYLLVIPKYGILGLVLINILDSFISTGFLLFVLFKPHYKNLKSFG